MTTQPESTTPEVSIPEPRNKQSIIVIGRIAITRTERDLDDLHEMRLLDEAMAQ